MSAPEAIVYAVGLAHASVCTNATDDQLDEMIARVNVDRPAGTRDGWKVSKEPTFHGGDPNPSPCNQSQAGFRHFLLEC